ncbi:MAG TPA: hypothetical protein VFU15_00590 [Bacteroidia bacterium]|nr:hypothetical protein [Bacteroidia bacterium]
MNYFPAIFCFITSLFFFSCSTSSPPGIKNTADTVVVPASKNKNTPASAQDTSSVLDVHKLCQLADSFWTKTSGRSVHLSLQHDTGSSVQFYRTDMLEAVNPAGNAKQEKFFVFEPGGNKDFSFSVITLTYPFIIDAMNAFSRLKKITGMNKAFGDMTPGLTYENDYVLLSGKTIFWMNASCAYDRKSTGAISAFVLHSLKTEEPVDSIRCGCGQAQCDTL